MTKEVADVLWRDVVGLAAIVQFGAIAVSVVVLGIMGLLGIKKLIDFFLRAKPGQLPRRTLK
jgi:hypothetical protein